MGIFGTSFQIILCTMFYVIVIVLAKQLSVLHFPFPMMNLHLVEFQEIFSHKDLPRQREFSDAEKLCSEGQKQIEESGSSQDSGSGRDACGFQNIFLACSHPSVICSRLKKFRETLANSRKILGGMHLRGPTFRHVWGTHVLKHLKRMVKFITEYIFF